MSSVAVRELCKVYKHGGVVALDDVSFSLEAGEAVAVIGPSGAGKTTLFRALTRTISVDGGTIEIDGIDLYRAGYLHLGRARQSIGVVYQKHNLVPQLSALHNVAIGMIGRRSTFRSLADLVVGVPNDERSLLEAALEQVGLAGKGDMRAANLSGGEQQRVAIARLLVQEPDLILADEPVASVDPASAEKIMEIFAMLNLECGKTIICNIHDVELAKRYFPRVLAISSGQLVFDGVPFQLTSEMLAEVYATAREHLEDDKVEESCDACIERKVREGLDTAG